MKDATIGLRLWDKQPAVVNPHCKTCRGTGYVIKEAIARPCPVCSSTILLRK